MTIPAMMRPPPALVTRLGSCLEITLCTRKARTSSRQRRLDTMLGEISCRARVRLVNAAKPQVDSPEQLSLSDVTMKMCIQYIFRTN